MPEKTDTIKSEIRQGQEKYAETLLHLLHIEDPKHPGINYYLLLHHKLRTFHGEAITDEETFDVITSVADELAQELLRRGENVSSLYASEIYELLEPMVMGRVS